MFCEKCGNELKNDENFCSKCGQKVNVPTNAIKSEKNKFYQTTWFTILMLIFFFPVGIFLVWKYNKFGSKKTKIIITVCALIWGIIVYALSSDDADYSSDIAVTDDNSTSNYYTINPETGKKETLDGQPYNEEIDMDAEIQKLEDSKAENNYSKGEFEDMCVDYAKEVVSDDDELDNYYKFKKVKEKDAYSKQACGRYSAESWEDIQTKIYTNLYEQMRVGKYYGASEAHIYVFIDEDNGDMVTFYVEAVN